MYGYVYEITNNINGKKYIGKRVGFNDVKTYMGSGIRLKAAQNKYGMQNFSKRILNEYETNEELNEAEKYFIEVYRYFYGREMMYNIADGGEGGGFIDHKHSEETKKKMSEAKKGDKNHNYGKHLSEETKKKLSESIKGENHPMYGRHHSEETKNKTSKSMKGKHPSEETKKKISESRKGENNPMAKKVNQYDKEGNFIKQWNCMKDAMIKLEISNISACCRGKQKSAGGYVWKYAD